MNPNLLRPLFLIDGSHKTKIFENQKLMQPIFLVDGSHVKKARPKPEKKIRRVGGRTIVHKRIPLSKRSSENCGKLKFGERKRDAKRKKKRKRQTCRRRDEFGDDDHASCGGAPTLSNRRAPVNNSCTSTCTTVHAPVHVRRTVRRGKCYNSRTC